MHFVFMLTWYATINKRRYVQQASHRLQGALGRGGQGSKQSVIFTPLMSALGSPAFTRSMYDLVKFQLPPKYVFVRYPSTELSSIV